MWMVTKTRRHEVTKNIFFVFSCLRGDPRTRGQASGLGYLKMLFGILTWTPMLGLSTSCVTATLPARLTT